MSPRKAYKTDLTDEQWEAIRVFVEVEQTAGRPREVDLREVVNTLLYLTHAGCPWDMLPHDLLPKTTAWSYFKKWKQDGTLGRILEQLNRRVRQAAGREEEPSLVIVDSQSTKTAHGGEAIGLDGFKKVKGRKRHMVTDVLGLVLAVSLTGANVPDGKLLVPLVQQLQRAPEKPLTVLADGAYGIADYPERFRQAFPQEHIKLQLTKKDPAQKTFKVIPKRWIVERTHAWNGNARRLSKDYEKTLTSSIGFIHLAAIARNLKRPLRPTEPRQDEVQLSG